MITALIFILLEQFVADYTGWLLVLPVLFDLVLISKLDK
jgi:hypothetical protein